MTTEAHAQHLRTWEAHAQFFRLLYRDLVLERENVERHVKDQGRTVETDRALAKLKSTLVDTYWTIVSCEEEVHAQGELVSAEKAQVPNPIESSRQLSYLHVFTCNNRHKYYILAGPWG